ncbi:MAG: class I SAM-dependent methyltransferase [Planctomycetaceae bacterium]
MTIGITNCLFGTRPIAAHCPGPLHGRWHHFADAVINQPAQQCECPDVTVLTWNTGERPSRPNKPCGVLERSLLQLGIQPTVLAQGKRNWKNRDKFAVTAEALSNVRTRYVIGADSADVVFFANPQIAVDRFRQHHSCQLLFNATGSRCWPELPSFVDFQRSLPMASLTQGRHWINSGLFVGTTEFCRHYFAKLALEKPVAGYEASDQAVVMQSWPDWYPDVQADYLSQIFQWFNEEPQVMRLERPLARRQKQLLKWFRTLPSPMVGAEVGVFRGNTSEALLRELPELSLWMVDPWRPFVGQSVFDADQQPDFDRSLAAAMVWTDFAKDRRYVLREASPEAASRFADQSLDFVFIDGNHLYENVCADIQAWWPKVRIGGLLTGHDYGVYGDRTEHWGVSRAVDEFVAAADRDLMSGIDGTWCVRK